MVLHSKLTVDLRKLPVDAWIRSEGPFGEYYAVDYEIGLLFGAGGIEFRFLHEGKVIGSLECEYV